MTDKKQIRKKLELSLNSYIKCDKRGKEYIPISGNYQKMLDEIVNELILFNTTDKKLNQLLDEVVYCARKCEEFYEMNDRDRRERELKGARMALLSYINKK